MQARMLYIHALSPIHTGTGQASGVIDLPVAREKVVAWPYLPGSSIKGVLRDACREGTDATLFTAAFGPETGNSADSAGGLWFTDGRLLCLPVRSYYGSFAWLTCPLALQRWARDHRSSGFTFALSMPEAPDEQTILVPEAASVIVDQAKVYLEDLDLSARAVAEAGAIAQTIAGAVFEDDAWRTQFQARFGIVSNELFSFLAETATDIVARVRINDETKTVAQGGLWYEELVPAEAIFVCPVLAAPRNGGTAADLYAVLSEPLATVLQIGGQASIGRGLVSMRLREVAP